MYGINGNNTCSRVHDVPRDQYPGTCRNGCPGSYVRCMDTRDSCNGSSLLKNVYLRGHW